MQLMDKALFAGVLILATQTTRIIPLILEKKIGSLVKNESMRSIVNDVLFLILICYCFRDISMRHEFVLRAGIAIYVFLIQFKFEKTLFSIFSGTALYMIGRHLL